MYRRVECGVGVVWVWGWCGEVLTVIAARLGRARRGLRRAAAQRAVHGRAAAPIKSDITHNTTLCNRPTYTTRLWGIVTTTLFT